MKIFAEIRYILWKKIIAQVYLIFMHFLIFPLGSQKKFKRDTWLAVMAQFPILEALNGKASDEERQEEIH